MRGLPRRSTLGAVVLGSAALAACGPAAEPAAESAVDPTLIQTTQDEVSPVTCPASPTNQICTTGPLNLARSSCFLVLGQDPLRWEVAQSFTVPANGYPNQVSFRLKLLQPVTSGTPYLVVDLRPMTGIGTAKVPLTPTPNWPSMTITAADLMAHALGTDYQYTLTVNSADNPVNAAVQRQPLLKAGQQYALVLRSPYDAANPGVLNVGIACNEDADSYAGGTAWTRELQKISIGIYQNLPFQSQAADLSMWLSLPDCYTGTAPQACGSTPWAMGTISAVTGNPTGSAWPFTGNSTNYGGAGTGFLYNGFIGDPQYSDWFQVSFPETDSFNLHGLGTPQLRFWPDPGASPTAAFPFRMEVRTNACPGGLESGCSPGPAAGLTQWTFSDTCTQNTPSSLTGTCTVAGCTCSDNTSFPACNACVALEGTGDCCTPSAAGNDCATAGTAPCCSGADHSNCYTRSQTWPTMPMYVRVYKAPTDSLHGVVDWCEHYSLAFMR